MYLSEEQYVLFARLLQTFVTLPYSTDLDGKDVETLLRIIKGPQGRHSRRKELFDIIDGTTGYSVKTLRKSFKSRRVDLQEQRYCDVDEIRRIIANGGGNEKEQGQLLLHYMSSRIQDQMRIHGIEVAKSLILLKGWDKARTHYRFKYWEEDFLGYISNLIRKNEQDEIEWIIQKAGIHGRDRLRTDTNGNHVRLLRMHYKHNQIFTDHDIPTDALEIQFGVNRISWQELAELLETRSSKE